jgi:hypothetical protein
MICGRDSVRHSAWGLPVARTVRIRVCDPKDSPVSSWSGVTFSRYVTPSGGCSVTESNTEHNVTTGQGIPGLYAIYNSAHESLSFVSSLATGQAT